tara:strand:- start:16890 stop:17921 length:1032 start_codon:yes stop_codon:yes gene_type:complete
MRFNPKDDDSRQSIEDYLEETGNQEEFDSYNNSVYAWNPNEDDTKILRVTKSKLGTFGWCREQYYLESFHGMRGEQRYYHDRGLNVHDMVEYFWDEFKETEAAVELINTGELKKAKKLLFDVIATPPEPFAYGEEEQIAQWVDWQFERLKVTKGIGWRPAKVEANIHATRFVEVDGVGIPIHMRGYIDTIFDTTEGGYALMELKTGKWKSNKMSSMRKEMGFYRMMLEYSKHQEFLPITHWGWEFPGGGIEGGEGPKIYYEDVKSGGKFAMKSVEKSLEKLVRAHIEMDFPPDPWMMKKRPDETLEDMLANKRMKCSWCDYTEQCSFWSITEGFLDKIIKEDE